MERFSDLWYSFLKDDFARGCFYVYLVISTATSLWAHHCDAPLWASTILFWLPMSGLFVWSAMIGLGKLCLLAERAILSLFRRPS